MVKIENVERPKLKKASVAVDTLILSIRAQANYNYRKLPEKKLCVLMVKEEGEQNWQVPKDAKRNDENLDQAALRKLKEVVGRNDIYIEQLYSFSDSFEQDDSAVNISYLALTPELILNQAQIMKDLTYKWFEITYRDLAPKITADETFICGHTNGYELLMETSDGLKEQASAIVEADHISKNREPAKNLRIKSSKNIGHMDSRILAYGIERLRNKIEYTDIVFHLMPERFTLKELQQVQELILDEKLYTAHFRRKIEPKLSKCLNQMREAKGHRPAQEYSYNPGWHVRTKLGGL